MTDKVDLEKLQRGCRHKYNECKRTEDGYWFRCCYCGHQIFGTLRRKAND